MSIAAAVAFVAGTAISVDANKASQRAQKRAADTTSAAQRNQDAAALRQQAREARRERARIQQVSENLGTSGSSKEIGAVGAIGNQLATSFANVSAQQITESAISKENSKMADAQIQGMYGQAIASTGMQAFSQTGGFDKLFSMGGGSGAA
tara:strand:+ start:1345 stop:1797 length:453 start_codon:yes stop_codon:yes gene_type:complete